jgi:hypothetical protein
MYRKQGFYLSFLDVNERVISHGMPRIDFLEVFLLDSIDHKRRNYILASKYELDK